MSSSVRSVLAEIASATTLSDTQKTSLVAATAAAASIPDVNLAQLELQNVSNVGIYLRSTGSEGWPRWQVLTALRAYGLNLTEKAAAPQPDAAAQAAQVQAQLESLVREARGVSLAQVQAAASQQTVQKAAPAPVQAPAASVPAPTPVKTDSQVTPAAAVDTLV